MKGKNVFSYFLKNYFIIIVIVYIVFSVLSFYGIKLFRFSGNANSALNILNSIAQVLGSILGIGVSLVILTMELTAQQHTLKITDIFFQDKINNLGPFLLLSFSVMISLYTSALITDSLSLSHILLMDFNLISSLFCLVTIFLYFIHIIHFINPESLVNRITEQVLRSIEDEYKSNY
ncbi:MAG: DUF2254 family protein [Candidatus Hodarchaeales archaeon]|jgi:uncharacterized membrane protein